MMTKELTHKEKLVLDLFLEGRHPIEIAYLLNITQKTVYVHLKSIREFYGANSVKHLRSLLSKNADEDSNLSSNVYFEILSRMSVGMTTSEISADLKLSRSTVLRHLFNMRKQHKVESNYQLVSYYFWRYVNI